MTCMKAMINAVFVYGKSNWWFHISVSNYIFPYLNKLLLRFFTQLFVSGIILYIVTIGIVRRVILLFHTDPTQSYLLKKLIYDEFRFFIP